MTAVVVLVIAVVIGLLVNAWPCDVDDCPPPPPTPKRRQRTTDAKEEAP